MNKTVEKAIQLIKESEWPDTQIPDLDVGDVVKLSDVWDGENETGINEYDYHAGEEHSYSYMIDEENGINYLFKIVKCGEKVAPETDEYGNCKNADEAYRALKDATVEIIDIYLI